MLCGKAVFVKANNAYLMRLCPWQSLPRQMSDKQVKSEWIYAPRTLVALRSIHGLIHSVERRRFESGMTALFDCVVCFERPVFNCLSLWILC